MPIGWRVYGELRKKRKKKKKKEEKTFRYLNLSREKKKETRSFVRSLDGEEGIFFFFMDLGMLLLIETSGILLLKVRHRKRGETNVEEQSRLARYSCQRHASVLFSQQHRWAEYKGMRE